MRGQASRVKKEGHHVKRIVVSLGIGLCILYGAPSAEATTFRMATLAPRNSSWMKILRRIARDVKKGTGGAVKIKFYPDGAMGDEPLVVEKMRLGQLQGAAVTNIGLSKIQPAILVQQLPMLFNNYKELDCLRDKMNAKFSAMMEEKGFVVLGYGDIGFVYLFTNAPAKSPSELKEKNVKMWAWTDDPISRKVVELAGLNSVPLALPDVLSNLQTGLIDAFSNAPYAAIALQWFTKAKYLIGVKIALGVGAVVVTKSAWDKVSEEHKKVIREAAIEGTKKLNARIRRDNRVAIKTLQSQGIEVIKLSKGELKPWREIARKVHKHFAGELYSQELLSEVKATLKACRSGG
jgi:TRAP-type C4-dicarboxylate transport system substrate-binding protein